MKTYSEPLAPIALFVYARVDHTKATLEALSNNDLSSRSVLYVFSDAPRNERDSTAVKEVRDLISHISGFKEVVVIERANNLGLANNIIDGVNMVTERHDRVIVMEDDIVTSPLFLKFMNDALGRYADDNAVWHINGWTYPIASTEPNKPFFIGIMECWGWATWRNRWIQYSRDIKRYERDWNKLEIKRFNIDGGYDYWSDMMRNKEGTIRTWAVFWYATIFNNNGLCLSPSQSYTTNIGIDGSGQNSGKENIYNSIRLNMRMPDAWPDRMTADSAAWFRIKDFLISQRRPLWHRLAKRAKWQIRKAFAFVRPKNNNSRVGYIR